MGEENTFIKYGPSFQTKVLSALLTDRIFLMQIYDILKPEYFESDSRGFISNIIIEYFISHKTLPTLDVFKVKFKDLPSTIDKAESISTLQEIYTQMKSSDLLFVKEETIKFCRNQELRRAIIDSVELLEAGKYDEIKVQIDNALKAGTDKDIGHEYFKSVDKRYDEESRNPVVTPWDSINELMGGGLSKGELGVIMSPAGVGKCVGGNTKIEIEYEEIGFELSGGYIIWCKPWDKIHLNDGLFITAYDASKLIPGGTTQPVRNIIKIGEFFSNNDIPEKEDSFYSLKYDVKIKTPYGFHKMPAICRTGKQKSIRLYFTNGSTLECSWEHKLKVNGGWELVKDIKLNSDVIETETGITFIKNIHEGKEKILYDLSVDKVHCFYSNNIVSHNTWFLCAIGANCIKQKKNVFHYTLELSEGYVGQRYDAILTQMNMSDLKYHLDDVKSTLKKYESNSNLVIKKFPARRTTLQHIQAHIEKIKMLYDIIPDIVLLDYADLLKPIDSRNDEYKDLQNIYTDITGFGFELGVPVWTASQTNRTGVNTEVITQDQIAGSYGKVMECDFLMSVSRGLDAKLSGTGTVHIAKNRFGPDGITLPAKINTTNGFIGIYLDTTIQGKKTKNDQRSGESLIKKHIQSRFSDLETNFG